MFARITLGKKDTTIQAGDVLNIHDGMIWIERPDQGTLKLTISGAVQIGAVERQDTLLCFVADIISATARLSYDVSKSPESGISATFHN